MDQEHSLEKTVVTLHEKVTQLEKKLETIENNEHLTIEKNQRNAGRKTKITTTIRNKIINLKKQGLSYNQIAKECKISATTAYNVCKTTYK